MSKNNCKNQEVKEQYVLEGGTHLSGKVKVSGFKNSALPIIAATVISPGIYKLRNVPEIKDVFHMLDIVEGLGGEVSDDVSEVTSPESFETFFLGDSNENVDNALVFHITLDLRRSILGLEKELDSFDGSDSGL